MIPEERYKLLMKNPQMQLQLANKNVVVFRGKAKDAIDMQLCKMGIVPYTVYAYSRLKKEDGIYQKFMEGLAKISESIGKVGIEQVAYKGVGGTGKGNYYYYNEKMNNRIEALSQKYFFEIFFNENPSVSQLKEKLLEEARQYTTDSIEVYLHIGGKEQEEIINEIRDILGEDAITKTVDNYNEKATLKYEQRYKKFVSGLPKLETEKMNESSQKDISTRGEYWDRLSKNINSVSNHVQSKLNFYNYYNISEQIPLSCIVEYAKEINSLFDKAEVAQSQNNSTSKVHGIQHVQNVLLLSNYIGLMSGVSYKDLQIIREAAIYHDIRHKWSGDSAHAKSGANWYLKNVDSNLNKEEVAYLIEAHELNGRRQLNELVLCTFPNITEQRKEELIRCAEILQDADRLDILRYNIENPDYQRFRIGELNNSQNVELVSAVIELNTKQEIDKGYLQIKDDKVCLSENTKTHEEQNQKPRFNENSILNFELQELASTTTKSGFCEMSQNIKSMQKPNKQEQKLREDGKFSKLNEGVGISDD